MSDEKDYICRVTYTDPSLSGSEIVLQTDVATVYVIREFVLTQIQTYKYPRVGTHV